MDWRIFALLPMVLWALYAVLGSLASRAQGENLTMIFEAGAMILIALFAFSRMKPGELQAATTLSMTHAALMGLCSAGGLLIQLYAFRVAPQSEQGVVVMLGGLFPVLAVVVFHLMSVLGFSGGSPATRTQWLGVALGAVALWLVATGGEPGDGVVKEEPAGGIPAATSEPHGDPFTVGDDGA